MNTFKNRTTIWKRAVLLGALTLAPTFVVTSQAEAAPNRPTWNNQRNDRRYDNRNDNRWDNNRRYDSRYDTNRRNDTRWDNNRRYDSRYDNRYDGRYDSRNNNNNGKKDYSTVKVIGAGIVGAILGGVLSR